MAQEPVTARLMIAQGYPQSRSLLNPLSSLSFYRSSSEKGCTIGQRAWREPRIGLSLDNLASSAGLFVYSHLAHKAAEYLHPSLGGEMGAACRECVGSPESSSDICFHRRTRLLIPNSAYMLKRISMIPKARVTWRVQLSLPSSSSNERFHQLGWGLRRKSIVRQILQRPQFVSIVTEP